MTNIELIKGQVYLVDLKRNVVKLKTKMVFYIIVLFKNQIIYYQKRIF